MKADISRLGRPGRGGEGALGIFFLLNLQELVHTSRQTLAAEPTMIKTRWVIRGDRPQSWHAPETPIWHICW